MPPMNRMVPDTCAYAVLIKDTVPIGSTIEAER